MINRELIRIKIVQLTYAYYQNGNRNMDNAEKELLFSLSKAYDLYNYLLALIVAVTREARHRVEVALRVRSVKVARSRLLSLPTISLHSNWKKTSSSANSLRRRSRLGRTI